MVMILPVSLFKLYMEIKTEFQWLDSEENAVVQSQLLEEKGHNTKQQHKTTNNAANAQKILNVSVLWNFYLNFILRFVFCTNHRRFYFFNQLSSFVFGKTARMFKILFRFSCLQHFVQSHLFLSG